MNCIPDTVPPQNLGPQRPAAGPSPGPHSGALRPVEVSLAPAPAPVNPQLSTISPQPFFPHAQGESDRAAEAFRIYLELGPKRRYSAVARKVGYSLRTVKTWARDFDWRGRIRTSAMREAEQYTQTQCAVQREQFLDAAARAKAFRDRQYDLAEAILDAAERYLEQADTGDLDLMSFADACKALEVASRIGQQTACDQDTPDAGAKALRDQLTALLDQAYGEAQKCNSTPVQPPASSLQPPA